MLRPACVAGQGTSHALYGLWCWAPLGQNSGSTDCGIALARILLRSGDSV